MSVEEDIIGIIQGEGHPVETSPISGKSFRCQLPLKAFNQLDDPFSTIKKHSLPP